MVKESSMIKRHEFFAVKNRIKKEKPMTHEQQMEFWFNTVKNTERINLETETNNKLVREQSDKDRKDYLKGREQNEKDNERFRGLMDRLENFLNKNNS